MAILDAQPSVRSRSDIVKMSSGVMLTRIEMLGARGEIASVEYHVSSRNSQDRKVFDNHADADWCFYEVLSAKRVSAVG